MKRFFFLFLGIFISTFSFSQVVNNLVVFCDEGEQFTLILNGERQNETPMTRVRVEGLTLPKYQVRIIFKNKKLRDDNPTLTFYSTCWECEFSLNKRGGKKHTMDFFTQKRIEGCGTPDNSQNNSQTNNGHMSYDNTGTLTAQDNSQMNSSNNTTTAGGCVNAIGNDEFNLLKNSVLQQNTDADKHSTVLSLLKNNCLTSLQVKDLSKLFTSEQLRLDFVKSIYSKITDKDNYASLLENFLSTALQDEFKKFLNKK